MTCHFLYFLCKVAARHRWKECVALLEACVERGRKAGSWSPGFDRCAVAVLSHSFATSRRFDFKEMTPAGDIFIFFLEVAAEIRQFSNLQAVASKKSPQKAELSGLFNGFQPHVQPHVRPSGMDVETERIEDILRWKPIQGNLGSRQHSADLSRKAQKFGTEDLLSELLQRIRHPEFAKLLGMPGRLDHYLTTSLP